MAFLPISDIVFHFSIFISLSTHSSDWTTPNHPSAIFNITHHRIHAFSIKIHSGVDECIKLWREKKHDYYYNLHQSSSIVLLRIRLISFLILIRIIGLCGQSSLFWKYDNNNEKIQRKKNDPSEIEYDGIASSQQRVPCKSEWGLSKWCG